MLRADRIAIAYAIRGDPTDPWLVDLCTGDASEPPEKIHPYSAVFEALSHTASDLHVTRSSSNCVSAKDRDRF